MVASISEKNKETIERIAPSTEELRNKYGRQGSTRLTPEEVKQACMNLETEIEQLNQIKGILKFTFVLIAILFLWIITKMEWRTVRFDGLTLLIANILLLNFHWLFEWFTDKFEEGQNATVNIRIVMSIALLIIQPILFYIAYKWNKIELFQNLHKQKWISYIAIVFTVLSGLLALVIGIGILLTPDLSGNIS